jgi:hypothetical protein
MEYTATFFTHSGAIRFEKFAKEQGLQVQLMPVPRRLSSSCGIAARMQYEGDIRELIIEDIDSIYDTGSQPPKLLYRHL